MHSPTVCNRTVVLKGFRSFDMAYFNFTHSFRPTHQFVGNLAKLLLHLPQQRIYFDSVEKSDSSLQRIHFHWLPWVEGGGRGKGRGDAEGNTPSCWVWLLWWLLWEVLYYAIQLRKRTTTTKKAAKRRQQQQQGGFFVAAASSLGSYTAKAVLKQSKYPKYVAKNYSSWEYRKKHNDNDYYDFVLRLLPLQVWTGRACCTNR